MMFWEPAGSDPCHSSQVHYRRWINVELTLLPLIDGGNGDYERPQQGVICSPSVLVAYGKGGSQQTSGSSWSHIHPEASVVWRMETGGRRKRMAVRTLSTCPHDFPILYPPAQSGKPESSKLRHIELPAWWALLQLTCYLSCHLSLLAVTVASFLRSKSAHQREAENWLMLLRPNHLD